MVQLGFRDASNNVVQGPHLTEFLKVAATATINYMRPGALVAKGSTDYDVSENYHSLGGNKPIGFLGYEEANANFKPDTRDSSYNAGDEVPVHNGGGFRVRARLAAYTGAIVKGDQLDASANGTLKKMQSTSNDPSCNLASAAESKANATSIQAIWVISHI